MARLLLALLVPVAAHVYWMQPPTRAQCYYEMPISQDGDGVFRGNPCGRPSRGVFAAMVAGSDACVSFRMSVAHTSSFRVALARGTAGTGDKQAGKPSFATPFDDPSALVAKFDCTALPGGCESDPSGRGDYAVSIRLPNSTAPGTYTLQLRQWAADLSWYYYDCADVLVVSSEAAIPPELAASWQAVTCPLRSGNTTAPSFSRVAYPNALYIQEAVMYGSAGILCILFLLFDVAFLVWRHSSCCGPCSGAPEPVVTDTGSSNASGGIRPDTSSAAVDSSPECSGSAKFEATGSSLDVEAGVTVAASGSGTRDSMALARPARGCSASCALRATVYETKTHPLILCVQAVLGVVSFVPMIAVISTWRDCAYRPSPVFGPT